uniref:Decapping nuclease n=1 Tax=Caenorhabditis tropicalis TaxID=1561998 RepID=A0A1I7T2R0_9PELO
MPVKADVETIGTYSVLDKKKLILNALPPRLNENLYGKLNEEIDLTRGNEGFKAIEDSEDSLLDYIQKTSKQGSRLKEIGDFIANARILNAFARSAELEIRAIRHNEVVFLVDKIAENADSSIQCLEKFKQYMTSNEKGEPRGDKLENKATTKVVNRLTLCSENSTLKVVYSAKIDAVDREGKLIELKTTALGHSKWVEKQCLRHYLQSFLANSPYTVYGRRTNFQEQIIHKIEKIPTKSIPTQRVTWKEEECFEKLFNILQEIESRLEFEDEAIVVKVTKDGIDFEEDDNCELVNPLFLRYFE